MILKSFFRKVSTKIYFIILFIAVFLICFLSLMVNYLDITKEEGYSKKSFVYVESEIDQLDKLKKDEDLKNIRQALRLKYDDTLFMSHLLEYPQINEKTLAIVDDGDYSLDNYEIIINFSKYYYDDVESNIDDYIGKKLNFTFNEYPLSLKIKNIIKNDNLSFIIISKELCNELSTYGLTNSYIANIRNEEVIYDVNDRYANSILLLTESAEEAEQRYKLEEYIKYLKLATYGVSLVFIILIIIINKNIRADLEKSKILEYKLGYTNLQVKLNFLKRIFSLHLLVFLLVFIIILGLIIGCNLLFNVLVSYSNLYLLLILFLIIIVSDILLAMFYK